MKISPQIYAEMKSAIANLDSERVAKGLPGYTTTAAQYREKGLTPRRFRADWKRSALGARWVCDVVYPTGCNDDHIDTALRQIARELTADKFHWAASNNRAPASACNGGLDPSWLTLKPSN